jgi:hypothetical protein
MNCRRAIRLSYAVVFVLVMFVSTSRADVRNQYTQFNFTKAIQVSDKVTLPPGTYWFKLASETSYPNNTIQIFDNTGKHITTVTTEVTDRRSPNDESEVNSKNTPTRLDVAQGSDHDTLLKWFYKGDNEGHKFTYSKETQQSISSEPVQTINVPSTKGAIPANLTANSDQQ